MSQLSELAHIECWISQPLSREVAQSIADLAADDDVARVAVMPDVHLARDVCVGLVVATRRVLYPAAVGSDIGCGMTAISFDAEADVLRDSLAAGRVLAGLARAVPSLKHTAATAPAKLPEALQSRPLSNPRLEKLKAREGRLQLGTLGRGNHFLELQADEQNRLWLMLHSGSRGIGQAISTHHQRSAQTSSRGRRVALDAQSPTGLAYLADADWAIAYAQANRLAMLKATVELLAHLFGMEPLGESLLDANHNHVRRELHFGKQFWVHRKGAQSARLDERGIIPGSMGTCSFLVSGRGSAGALCSSSHGAGRALGRGEAARVIHVDRLQREMRGVWFDQRRSKSLCDEAPSAYKNIRAVMRAQRELTRIDCQLRPLLSYKG